MLDAEQRSDWCSHHYYGVLIHQLFEGGKIGLDCICPFFLWLCAFRVYQMDGFSPWHKAQPFNRTGVVEGWSVRGHERVCFLVCKTEQVGGLRRSTRNYP